MGYLVHVVLTICNGVWGQVSAVSVVGNWLVVCLETQLVV